MGGYFYIFGKNANHYSASNTSQVNTLATLRPVEREAEPLSTFNG